jgi:hypothetical protein
MLTGERPREQHVHQVQLWRKAFLKSQEVVIEVLELRFSELPSALVEKINQIEDPDLLKTLLREAITIDSLAAFQSLT